MSEEAEYIWEMGAGKPPPGTLGTPRAGCQGAGHICTGSLITQSSQMDNEIFKSVQTVTICSPGQIEKKYLFLPVLCLERSLPNYLV